MKDKVVFYNDGVFIGDSVFAVFPYMTGTIDPHTMQMYAHVGQHGSACMDYLDECRLATPDQYRHLKSELEGIGYDLEVLEDYDRQEAFEARERELIAIAG